MTRRQQKAADAVLTCLEGLEDKEAVEVLEHILECQKVESGELCTVNSQEEENQMATHANPEGDKD